MPSPPTPILTFDVKDFGAVGDGVNDDTLAIQSAIDAAVYTYSISTQLFVASGPSLYFPPGKYMISSTLLLGGSQLVISILGDNAILIPHDRDLFSGYAVEHVWCYDVQIQGLNFINFKLGLRVVNLVEPGHYLESGQLQISNCAFQGSEEAVRIDVLNTITEIESCKFSDNLVAVNVNHSEKTVIRNCWITPQENMTGSHSATIINSGRLVVENCILVPLPQSSAFEPAWINNFNCVTVKDTRQGGEPNSMTLINNYAGVGNTMSWNPGDYDPTAVIVSDCFCYGLYNGPNTPSGFVTPAVVRYVGAIPNLTTIVNNCGMVYSRIIGFSALDSPTDIQNIIDASGPLVNGQTVSIKVENNVGGVFYDNGSHIPSELLQFVRSNDSLWARRRSFALPLLATPIISGGGDETITYKFEFPGDFIFYDAPLLVSYSGNPHMAGSAYYKGGYVGILRANGFWSNPGNIGEPRIALDLHTLVNQIGYDDPASWPTGNFTVEVYWDQTMDLFLPSSSPNKVFYIKITGRSGATFSTDDIVVVPLPEIQY